MRSFWLLLPLALIASPLLAQEAPTPPAPPAGPSRVRHTEQLTPIAKVLIGTFMGPVGKASGVCTGSWGLHQTAVMLKTRRAAQSRSLSERLWVFTWDTVGKRFRCRVVGEGRVLIFDVAATQAEGEASLTLTEAAREGAPGPKETIQFKRTLRTLTITRAAGEQKETWTLSALGRPPTQRGPFQPAATKLKIPHPGGKTFMPAQVHYPKGRKPFPVIVFSPGGKAPTPRGYELFAQWYASWGWVVVVVGFGDTPAEDRAKRFGQVADWLTVANAQANWPLTGGLQLKTLVAAGHSRGGHAALLAAQRDKRFTACLALAPAGPATLGAGLEKPLGLISGAREANKCRALYGSTQAPRLQVAIAGMDHFFRPADRSRLVLSHSTAFLEGIVRGRTAYAHWLELARQRGVGIAIQRAAK